MKNPARRKVVAKKVVKKNRKSRSINLSSKPRAIIFVLVFALIGVIATLFIRAATVITVTNATELDTALRNATGGEIIELRAGTYGVHYLPKPYASTVTIKGADGQRANVKVGGFKTYSNPGSTTLAANIVITNMTITGLNTGTEGAVRINKGSHDIKLEQVTINGGTRNVVMNAYPYDESTGVVWPYNITIADSDLSQSGGDNVQITGARNVVIRNNYIHEPKDVPSDHVDGVQLIASDKVYIIGNTFRDVATGTVGPNQAIMVGRSEPFVSYLNITNTYIANNLIFSWRGSGIIVAGTTNTYIVNNTAVDMVNNGGGFYTAIKDPAVKGGTASDWYNNNLQVWNNIFSQTNITRTGQPATSYPAYESNNMITTSGTGTLGTNLIVGDPQFVTKDYTSLDKYKLRSGSLAINSGVLHGTSPYGTPTFDIDNLTRDSTPDRGAREYGGTTSTPPPPPPPPPTSSDTTAPTVTISNPKNGITVNKPVSINASATDNVGVSRMELYINGSKAYQVNASSLSFNWNPRKATGNIFVITVKAYDSVGNAGQYEITIYK